MFCHELVEPGRAGRLENRVASSGGCEEAQLLQKRLPRHGYAFTSAALNKVRQCLLDRGPFALGSALDRRAAPLLRVQILVFIPQDLGYGTSDFVRAGPATKEGDSAPSNLPPLDAKSGADVRLLGGRVVLSILTHCPAILVRQRLPRLGGGLDRRQFGRLEWR